MRKLKNESTENAELMLFSNPPNLLISVREGHAASVPTKQLNVFYAMADSIERALKILKDKCRPVIIDRRNEGIVTGEKLQHRQFHYVTPQGNITLTIQERIAQKPDPAKLESLLKAKDLWQIALSTALDMVKVEGLLQAGLLTPEEMAGVSGAPEPVYALIARIEKK